MTETPSFTTGITDKDKILAKKYQRGTRDVGAQGALAEVKPSADGRF